MRRTLDPSICPRFCAMQTLSHAVPVNGKQWCKNARRLAAEFVTFLEKDKEAWHVVNRNLVGMETLGRKWGTGRCPRPSFYESQTLEGTDGVEGLGSLDLRTS